MTETGEKNETATFAGGCFWQVEDEFRKLPGVTDVEAGYTGGTVPNPSYEDVCTGETGHAEAVLVSFDPKKTSFEKLLDAFWDVHDPTQLDGQGLDIGRQYRSAIFYHSGEQQKLAEASRDRLAASGKYKGEIITEIVPAQRFYRAEDYHQHYLAKRRGEVPNV